jgi:hypothetical protein
MIFLFTWQTTEDSVLLDKVNKKVDQDMGGYVHPETPHSSHCENGMKNLVKDKKPDIKKLILGTAGTEFSLGSSFLLSLHIFLKVLLSWEDGTEFSLGSEAAGQTSEVKRKTPSTHAKPERIPTGHLY